MTEKSDPIVLETSQNSAAPAELVRKDRPSHVIGPVGEMLTFESLPPANTRRWTPHRKAEVIAAVRGGLLTFDEACHRYSLATEELIGWQRALQRSGIPGLRVTRLQRYVTLYERRDGY